MYMVVYVSMDRGLLKEPLVNMVSTPVPPMKQRGGMRSCPPTHKHTSDRQDVAFWVYCLVLGIGFLDVEGYNVQKTKRPFPP